MNVRLNLAIDEVVVANMKEYARFHRKSISEIVEAGMIMLTGVKPVVTERNADRKYKTLSDIRISSFIKNFHAGIEKVEIPADLDYKQLMANDKKYA